MTSRALLPDLERLDSADAAAAGADAADDRDDEVDANDDADHARHSGEPAGSEGRDEREPAAMGDAFNDSQNDDTFYLPPEIFDNEDFKRGMESFISPDGHAVRFIISHEGDPLTADGIERIDAIKSAAFEAIKGTPLEGSKVYLGGTASAFKDMQEGNNYDLLIAGIAALTLIFIIMLLITRSVVAAASSSAPWCCRSAHRSGCRFCSGSTCWASNCTSW